MKIHITILILVIALLALPAAAMTAVIGKITAFEGNVDILRQGQEMAAPVVRLEEPVSEGDILRTKSNGKAEITFIDNTIMRLAPGSRLGITEYLTEGSKRKSGVMSLFRGKIRAVVSKSKGFLSAAFGEGARFEVRTPIAVAGVKGTDFFVSYSMGVTSILVTDGKVDVFNPAIPGQIVRVTEGNAAFVVENKPPSQPRPANDVEIIRHTKDTDTGEQPKEKKGDKTITTQTTADTGEQPKEKKRDKTITTQTTADTGEQPKGKKGDKTVTPQTTAYTGEQPKEKKGDKTVTPQTTAYATDPGEKPKKRDETVTPQTTANPGRDGFGFPAPDKKNPPPTPTDTGRPIPTIIPNSEPYPELLTDIFAPIVSIAGPPPATNSQTAVFTVTFNEPVSATYTMGSFGATTTNTTSDTFSIASLSKGSHTLTVTATDAAGNTSTTTYLWTTDYTASAAGVITASGNFSGLGFIGVAGNSALTADMWRYNITGQNWGISKSIISGDYKGPTSDTWSLSTTVTLPTTIYGTQTDGTQWSNGMVAGQTYGYGADITATPNTWITVGETIGTFDAATLTWQAVQTGAWWDTNKFLAMVAANDTATLTALNIPFAEVGRTTLIGSGNGFSDLRMTDTIFFADKVSAAPKIWATGSVTGTYTAPPTTGTDILLSGGPLKAAFAFQTWDANSGKWISTVNGTGGYNGATTFNGAAAGTGATTRSGSITGTGAGVVK